MDNHDDLSLLERLIQGLCILPGVGPKSAQRMALHLLQHKRSEGLLLSDVLNVALQDIKNCQHCRQYTESNLCEICTNPRRDNSILCVVETPADLLSIEQTKNYKGKYFVLLGHLSPIDGIGPNELGLSQLEGLLTNDELKEVILATNPTVEGDATAHYIADLIAHQHPSIAVSRIAYGVPLGSELEYTDLYTLTRAIEKRESYA